jgi:FtsP/CotA-like multicopper oxidase with cupredoxin domain
MDGVVGLTQCPIPSPDAAAPDINRMVYSFTPDRPGTFWYHGHYNAQYPDGLYGALIIEDGGASMAGARQGNENAAYDADTDEWVWQAADWYDASSVALLGAYLSPDSDGEEPVPDAIVVNGLRSDGALALRTSRTQRQLVRFINTAAFSMWRVSVDGMPLILVELDGTAVEPMEVPFLEVNVAQRASFVLDWSRMHADVAASPALWFRVQAMPHMYRSYNEDLPDLGLYGSAGGQPFNINWAGLIRFEEDAARAGAAAMPSYETPPAFETPPVDMNLQAARSWPPMPAPPPTHQMYIEFAFAVDEDGITRGYINGDTAHMAMGAQLLAPELYAYASRAGGPLSDAATPLSGALHGSAAVPFVIPMDAVVDVLVNNTARGDHPMHLHGHDHWVIASSDAPDLGALYAPHYVRRDVVTAPSGGWAKFRFIADNPGIHMFHCHLGAFARAPVHSHRWRMAHLALTLARLTVRACSRPHTDWHMHIGMIATFVEAPSELAMGAMAGKLATSPSHEAACAAQRASYEAREAPAASGAHHGA